MTPDQRDTEMERDAARYRWLRALKARYNPPVDGSIWCVQYHQPRGTIPELRSAGFGSELDAAIDAAMAKES